MAGGRIDHGHHASRADRALTETLELSNAVETAVNMTSEEDTLIIVTGDHSHAFVLGGYNPRGARMLGKESKSFKMNVMWHSKLFIRIKVSMMNNLTIWESVQ